MAMDARAIRAGEQQDNASDDTASTASRAEEQHRDQERIDVSDPLDSELVALARSTEALSPAGMRAAVLLLDPDRRHLRHAAAPSLPTSFAAAIDGIAIGPHAGCCGAAAWSRTPVVVRDIASDPRWVDLRELASEHRLGACWSHPVISSAGDLLGTFALYAEHPRTPAEVELETIAFAAQTAALLIERRRAEAALVVSEQRVRTIIDALPVAIVTTDADGWLTHVNPAAVAFSGREPQLGHDRWCVNWRLYQPDGAPMPHDESPMAIALRARHALQGVEAIAERPDGTRVWFSAYPTPLWNAEQQLTGGINMLVDITERKRAEEMRARLAAIVESSDDAIISKDLNGTIMTWNAGAERIFGYAADEVVGGPITILIPVERLDEEPEILARIRRGARVDHFETVRRCKDGRLLDISLTVSPVVDGGGQIVGASKIARDISERRALERQRDAFVSIAAHELRTPVTGIKASTQLLARRMRREGDSASAVALDRLDAQVDRLAGLITDLLDVTRLDGGSLPFRPTRFALDELLHEAIDEVQRTATRHRIVAESIAPITLTGDRGRIGQVVTNLLTNAIRYSPEADRVVVRAVRSGQDVVVSVQDFGIGIPKAHQRQLFDRYYSVPGDDRASYAGLGLGLFIAAEFVKRHRGSIWVESDEGHGATFAFSLPLDLPLAETTTDEDATG